MSVARLSQHSVETMMDLPDTSRAARPAIGTFDLSTPIRASTSMQSTARHLHAPIPPEVDPNSPPKTPPNIDPEPIPDDPLEDPHEPPEGDPPAAPPPLHAIRV